MNLFILCIGVLIGSAAAATIDLTVKFSNSSLSPTWFVGEETRVFGINFYTCLEYIGTEECPGGQASFQPEFWIRTTDMTASDTWFKRLELGNTYTGTVVLGVFAPQPFAISSQNEIVVTSSVTECADDLADFEMGVEICGHHGQPWTISVEDVNDSISVEIFPSFGIGETGQSSVILPQFYSAQLDNYRDVAVYVPPSLLQNKVRRAVNMVVVLDGALSTIQSYSLRTGFEAAQIMGVVPESIMIGITTIEFAYQLDFDQRTYEMTYESALPSSCILGPRTGGAPLMLQWVDEDVIPAILAQLGDIGMDRGEVTITGGSLGGLTSCYAAASRPDIFQRAVCSSPSNCFNFENGGLSTIITSQFESTGISAKTVIQFLGQEVYDEDLTNANADENQLEYLMRDDSAWKGIGLTPLVSDFVFTPVNPSTFVTQPYTTLARVESKHIIMTFLLPGGQHAPSSWEQEFAAALPNLYRADPPDKLRIPKSESLKYMSITSEQADTSDDSDEDDNAVTLHVLMAIVIFLALLVIVVGWYAYKLRDSLRQMKETNNVLETTSPAHLELK